MCVWDELLVPALNVVLSSQLWNSAIVLSPHIAQFRFLFPTTLYWPSLSSDDRWRWTQVRSFVRSAFENRRLRANHRRKIEECVEKKTRTPLTGYSKGEEEFERKHQNSLVQIEN